MMMAMARVCAQAWPGRLQRRQGFLVPCLQKKHPWATFEVPDCLRNQGLDFIVPREAPSSVLPTAPYRPAIRADSRHAQKLACSTCRASSSSDFNPLQPSLLQHRGPMVAMMAVQFNQKHGSWAAHSPGELEGMANQAVYLSPNGKASGGDYIPAYKGTGRRLPMTDAFNSEAQQLKDADLDLRMNARVERVFGNGLFEGAEPQLAPKNSSGVKMNNLFTDNNKKQNLNSSLNSTGGRDASGGPDKGTGLAARRNASSTPEKSRAPTVDVMEGTEVRDFHDPDEDTLPVVGRQRGGNHSTSVAQNYNTWEAQLKHLIASGRREDAVRMPAAPGRMTRCYIKRVKNLFNTHCCFQMYMDGTDIFLLAARRRKKSKTSSYVISLDLDDLKRDTENCMAKLKANFVGTEYTLWGRRPQDGSISDDHASDSGNENRKGYGKEDLCINFKQTALKSKGGPRSMYAIVPTPGTEQAASQTQDNSAESLGHCLELARKRELPPYLERRYSMMCTKQPEWDPNVKAFTLDFQGRVKEASVKNFQLVGWDHNTDRTTSELLLQFGKQSDDVYALDFMYPFTVESAFAIALASIDTKLCYTI